MDGCMFCSRVPGEGCSHYRCPKATVYLLQRFRRAIRNQGSFRHPKALTPGPHLSHTNERWSVGAIGSGRHSGQTMWLQEPSFLCRSIPISSHSLCSSHTDLLTVLGCPFPTTCSTVISLTLSNIFTKAILCHTDRIEGTAA